jgi:hypothetical protein
LASIAISPVSDGDCFVANPVTRLVVADVIAFLKSSRCASATRHAPLVVHGERPRPLCGDGSFDGIAMLRGEGGPHFLAEAVAP